MMNNTICDLGELFVCPNVFTVNSPNQVVQKLAEAEKKRVRPDLVRPDLVHPDLVRPD